MVILTLLILGLKYCGKLPRYLCLPPWANVLKLFVKVIYSHSTVITKVMLLYNTEWQYDHGMAVNYRSKKFYNIGPRSKCHKTLIYSHSTVTPSFCAIKQYYDSNYHGMAVSNTMVIYIGISTLEITGIFITLAVNYQSIWTLEKVGFYRSNELPRHFYNIGHRD